MTRRARPRLAGLLLPAAAVGWGAWSSRRAEAHYRALAALTDSDALSLPAAPFVSIIVPARDEAGTLPALLGSLQRLTYPGGYEVIVVDDASADGTGEVAAAHGARMLRLEERDRPDGWLGKPNACHRGAAVARGEWLLFLDADTTLSPGVLRAMLSRALGDGVDALSLLLRQRCQTFWERLLLPYAFQQFFAGVDPARLADPGSDEALLNGQCILIRRAVYDAVGGHGAVRGSIVEDVALARTLKAAGYRVQTFRGERLGTVRMYDSMAAIRAGFGKNAYAFLADAPRRGLQVALASTCAAAALPLAAGGLLTRRAGWFGLGALAWAALAAGSAPWTRRFGAGTPYALLQPLAAAVFQAIALESAVRSLAGRPLAWKGRRYGAATTTRGRGLRPLGLPAHDLLSPPRLPYRNLLALSLTIARGERRSLRADSAAVVRQLRGRWQAHGVEHVPAAGSVCLVINHWQRPGLWIGWGGSLLGFLVGRRRPLADPPVHWLVLSELRLRVFGAERHLAPADPVLRRVAHAWQMVPLSLDPSATAQRAQALRQLRALCAQGRVIGVFPEGHHGAAGAPGRALPGSGRFLASLAHRGAAIVPTALWEQDGTLQARFGPPLAGIDADHVVAEEAERAVMHGIAALLPAHRRPGSAGWEASS